jgi:hypothetical protein
MFNQSTSTKYTSGKASNAPAVRNLSGHTQMSNMRHQLSDTRIKLAQQTGLNNGLKLTVKRKEAERARCEHRLVESEATVAALRRRMTRAFSSMDDPSPVAEVKLPTVSSTVPVPMEEDFHNLSCCSHHPCSVCAPMGTGPWRGRVATGEVWAERRAGYDSGHISVQCSKCMRVSLHAKTEAASVERKLPRQDPRLQVHIQQNGEWGRQHYCETCASIIGGGDQGPYQWQCHMDGERHLVTVLYKRGGQHALDEYNIKHSTQWWFCKICHRMSAHRDEHLVSVRHKKGVAWIKDGGESGEELAAVYARIKHDPSVDEVTASRIWMIEKEKERAASMQRGVQEDFARQVNGNENMAFQGGRFL